LLKHPIGLVAIAFLLALVVNVFFYSTGTDLTSVVSKTLFADTIIVLSLIPISQAIRIGQTDQTPVLGDKVKSGMKSVALYTFLVALMTFVLLKLFGEPLIADRLNLLQEMLANAVAEGKIEEAQLKQQMDLANQIYSPSSQVLIVIMANLFVGFISSLLAAVLVKKS
jgi:hypothetical protein